MQAVALIVKKEWCRRQLGTPSDEVLEDVEDTVRDAIRFEKVSCPVAYAKRVALNRAVRLAVQEATHQRRLQEIMAEIQRTSQAGPTVEELAQSRIDLYTLLDYVQQMPSPRKMAVLMRMQEYSIAEIRLMTGLTERQILNTVRKVRRQLAKVLGRD